MGKQTSNNRIKKQDEGSLGRALFKSRFVQPTSGLDLTKNSGGTDRWVNIY
jgi:hypothetical protein